MVRNCPECNCEIVYKKIKSYENAEMNNICCRSCNWRKIARDPERNRKVSEARKKWWEERRADKEAYETTCKKMGKNNSGIWSDESKKEAWASKRWSEENRQLMSAAMKVRWDTLSDEEAERVKNNMV